MMSKSIEEIVEKWEVTGILSDLSDEKK